jgi:hypothetical protein
MKFKAKLSGDGECFCFLVDKETYIKFKGEEYNNELKLNNEMSKEIGFDIPFEYYIYPRDLLGYNKEAEVKIEILDNKIIINKIF